MGRRPSMIHTPVPVDNSSILDTNSGKREKIEHTCEAQARCDGCIQHSVTYQGLTVTR